MLSGSLPRGSSSTPVSGKIGSVVGSSASPGSDRVPLIAAAPGLREQERRQATARRQGQRLGRPHRLEELDELLARRLLVPLAVALDEVEQLVDRRLALADGAAREASGGVDILRLLLQDLAVDIGGAAGIAGGEGLLRHLERLLDRRGAGGAAEALDELLDLALRQGADEAVDRPPVLEGIDGGDRLDAHLLRDLRALVDIDLDHAHGALGLAHRLLEQRPQLLARAAPRRPEIDDHRAVMRGVDDIGHEGGGRRVLDELRAARAGGAADYRFHNASPIPKLPMTRNRAVKCIEPTSGCPRRRCITAPPRAR